ncbi:MULTISPECIES: MmcQ/YjbR family DNA-binding protein [Rhodobacterales]|uniref:MmcQ/YjbR family DNA-binding protein n=1 Tax=Rhodobacterales TaxID=204455 RepID=UPI004059996B
MTRAEFDAQCAAMPGATRSGPGELDSWKIGGKMFACWGDYEHRDTNTASVVVATPDRETAEMLVEAGAAHWPPYFRGAWVGLTLDGLDADEARHRIAVSYARVRKGLTKKAQAELPPLEES